MGIGTPFEALKMQSGAFSPMEIAQVTPLTHCIVQFIGPPNGVWLQINLPQINPYIPVASGRDIKGHGETYTNVQFRKCFVPIFFPSYFPVLSIIQLIGIRFNTTILLFLSTYLAY